MKWTTRLLMGAGIAALALPMVAGPTAAHAAPQASLDLVQPIADYKVYVSQKADKLLADTAKFVAAVKAGDIRTAKALYPGTRMNYEAIEPVAELFSDLDSAMDARADDFEKHEQDPKFTGFHRIEYGLWQKNSTAGLEGVADKLLADAKDLDTRIAKLVFPPEKVFGGAADLMNEVAATKVSGEEDRYSHTDLWDFQANVDGSQKIFELVRPVLARQDPAFVKRVAGNFQTVDATLAKYRTAHGYELYDKLSKPDRVLLAAKVNTLAEDLATLRGKLGLN